MQGVAGLRFARSDHNLDKNFESAHPPVNHVAGFPITVGANRRCWCANTAGGCYSSAEVWYIVVGGWYCVVGASTFLAGGCCFFRGGNMTPMDVLRVVASTGAS